jgi:hypothetical protein
VDESGTRFASLRSTGIELAMAFDDRRHKAMSEFVLPKADYWKARYKVCCLAMSAVTSLIDFLDYYGEKIENQPQGLRKFMKAHDGWLTLKFLEARGAYHHSLAALGHLEYLQKVLAEMFERFVLEVKNAERTHGLRDVEWSISHNREDAVKLRHAIAEFNTTYATEIAADQASDAYEAEQVVIAKCLADLRLATLGKWTPELVYVKDLGRELEIPGSVALGEIAELARAGGLRLPRTLLASDPA